MFNEQQKKKLSEHQAYGTDVYVSNFEGMELTGFIKVASVVCAEKHQPAGSLCSCEGLIKVARCVEQEGWMNLKQAFILSSPGRVYSSVHTRQKLLQMPLAAIAVGNQKQGTQRLFLVRKQQFVNYKIFQSLQSTLVESQKECMSKEQMKKLLNLADSEAEEEWLRFAVVRGAGMSTEKARSVYGFHDMTTRTKKVLDAAEEAQDIKECMLKVVCLKDKALLQAFGVDDSASEESESESETDVDSDDTSGMLDGVKNGNQSSNRNEDGSKEGSSELLPTEEGVIPHQFQLRDYMNSDETYKHVTETEGVYMNSHQLLDILRKCALNWFEFVMIPQRLLSNISDEALHQLLLDFGGQIAFLGLSVEEERVIEQSRQAYLLSQRLQSIRGEDTGEEIVSESNVSEGEMLQVEDLLGERGRAILNKKRSAVRRKGIREVKRRIAERRFQKRRRSKRVSQVLRDSPGIGQAIEDFAKACGAGADAWQRTGALTFDGNRKIKQKATFKKIKEHLEQKYNRSISYGSVVQLCVARNRRRRSAVWYKGVANVIQRRARKEFNLKYNLDVHWSSAFYASLNHLQYKDGHNIVNLGRDDQAGFRLDTMTTHKLHSTLSIKGSEPLTTYTDYVNKYPSTLQTTSYNFSGTDSTGEICCGVVKATPLHWKNVAQHFADLKEVEEKDSVRPAFINPITQEKKKIECIRVDGAFHEGPPHKEVQYWWTRRHLEVETVVTLVSSRNSGASFRNRVELQNGCLALGHTNLFIPSTLNGSCLTIFGRGRSEHTA